MYGIKEKQFLSSNVEGIISHYPLASVDVEKFIDATVAPLEVIYILWPPLGFTP